MRDWTREHQIDIDVHPRRSLLFMDAVVECHPRPTAAALIHPTPFNMAGPLYWIHQNGRLTLERCLKWTELHPDPAIMHPVDGSKEFGAGQAARNRGGVLKEVPRRKQLDAPR